MAAFGDRGKPPEPNVAPVDVATGHFKNRYEASWRELEDDYDIVPFEAVESHIAMVMLHYTQWRGRNTGEDWMSLLTLLQLKVNAIAGAVKARGLDKDVGQSDDIRPTEHGGEDLPGDTRPEWS